MITRTAHRPILRPLRRADHRSARAESERFHRFTHDELVARDKANLDIDSAKGGVTAIAASTHHSLALKKDGGVVAWGCGRGGLYGQCSVSRSARSGVIAIAAGWGHSLALKKNGSVIAWGCYGKNIGQCRVPASARRGVIAVAAGYAQGLALKVRR